MTSHHLHPNPDVDDMLRAANARAEAAKAERDTLDALRKEALNQRDAAERRLAEQQAAVLALIEDARRVAQYPMAASVYVGPLERALSDPTALDALIARERAAALREAADALSAESVAFDIAALRLRDRATAEAER